MTDRIEAIRKRVDAVPTMRWQLEDGEIMRDWEGGGRDTLLCYRKVPIPEMLARFRSEADAELVAHALDDMRLLLHEIEHLEWRLGENREEE